jgi:hypothetical protein
MAFGSLEFRERVPTSIWWLAIVVTGIRWAVVLALVAGDSASGAGAGGGGGGGGDDSGDDAADVAALSPDFPRCSSNLNIFSNPELESFQIITVPSCEHDASIDPNMGCDHATCQTGPSCLDSNKQASEQR